LIANNTVTAEKAIKSDKQIGKSRTTQIHTVNMNDAHRKAFNGPNIAI